MGCPVSENGDAPDLADPPGRKMAVDDGVDLVGALRRLVDALRVHRDDTLGIRKHLEERRDILLGQAGRQRGGAGAAGDAARTGERIVEARGVALDVVAIERAVIGKMNQQPAEQRGVGAGLEARNSSSSPTVSVRRGSITTMRAPRCCLLASMRWYSTGWHQAALEPTSTRRSASSRSS